MHATELSQARFASFSVGDRHGYGVVIGGGAIDLSGAFAARYPTLREVVAAGAFGELLEAAEARSPDLPIDRIKFEIPIAAPEKIVCIGVNYPDRNAEYKDGQSAQSNPSLFVRFPRSFVGHDQPIMRPHESHQLDYEGEVAVIIGKPGRRIAASDALSHVAALALCNEGTLRDWVRHAKFNVTQGKNFERSGAMGPWLVPFQHESQVADIKLETRVNGEVRQSDRTSRMIFSFRRIISYVSTFTTLVPGDILVCGTPTGAGARFEPPRWLAPGDVVEIEAEGIGVLRNTVMDEAP
jgi:2-keto-4-pentenoate hydratase/2-oxohepta-3-ene-1,7-dioic acid hydratase in catechol pathway